MSIQTPLQTPLEGAPTLQQRQSIGLPLIPGAEEKVTPFGNASATPTPGPGSAPAIPGAEERVEQPILPEPPPLPPDPEAQAAHQERANFIANKLERLVGEGMPYVDALDTIRREDFPNVEAEEDTIWKQLLRSAPSNALAALGGISGGVAGSQIGTVGAILGAPAGPIGSTGGAVILGALGAAAGGAAGRGIEIATGLDPNAPTTVPEIAKDIALTGAVEGAFEGVLGTGGRVIRWLNPGRKLFGGADPDVGYVTHFIRSKVPHAEAGGIVDGAVLTPSQLTNNRFWDVLQNVADAGYFTSTTTVNRQNMENALRDGLLDIADQLAVRTTDDQFAKAMALAISGEMEGAKFLERMVWNSLLVQGAQKGITVPTKTLQKFGANATESVIQYLEEIGKVAEAASLKRAVQGLADEIPLDAAVALQSELTTRGRALVSPGQTEKSVSAAKQMSGIFGEAIGKALPAELRTAHEMALSLTRTRSRKFNNEFIQDLLKKVYGIQTLNKAGKGLDVAAAEAANMFTGRPANVAHALLNGMTESEVHRLKDVVGEEFFTQLQGSYVEGLLLKAGAVIPPQRGPKLLPGTLHAKELNALLGDKTTRETLESLFGDRNQQFLQDFEDYTLALSKAQNVGTQQLGEGVGKIFIQLSQANAISHVLVGAGALTLGGAGAVLPALMLLGAQGAAIIGPGVAGKMLTTKNLKLRRLFIQGVQKGFGEGEKGTRLTGQLVKALGEAYNNLTPREQALEDAFLLMVHEERRAANAPPRQEAPPSPLPSPEPVAPSPEVASEEQDVIELLRGAGASDDDLRAVGF